MASQKFRPSESPARDIAVPGRMRNRAWQCCYYHHRPAHCPYSRWFQRVPRVNATDPRQRPCDGSSLKLAGDRNGPMPFSCRSASWMPR